MHAAEKFADRKPPPEIASPKKKSSSRGRVVAGGFSSAKLARVAFFTRDSSGICGGFSGLFTYVQPASAIKQNVVNTSGRCLGMFLSTSGGV